MKQEAENARNMERSKPPSTETRKKMEVGSLDEFDMAYFRQLEGADGWIALGQGNCHNQKYFTVLSDVGEKLGIVGVYDTDDEQNITHTIVDPKFRGQGLAFAFKKKLMDQVGLDSITLTIDLDNAASIKAAEKIPGIKKISDEAYEKEYHKAKYGYAKPNDEK